MAGSSKLLAARLLLSGACAQPNKSVQADYRIYLIRALSLLAGAFVHS